MSPIFTDYLSSILILISITWIFTIILKSNLKAQKSKHQPPGPFPFPIIGNILALGPKPHRSLANLARTHGPVMSLKLGSITSVVISSPETRKIMFAKNELLVSSRKAPLAIEIIGQDELSVGWLPVGSQWRKLRKICKEQLFSYGSYK